MTHPPCSLLLKANQQALQRRAQQARAKSQAVGDVDEMTKENLAALIECDEPEIANAAHMMMALYFAGD
jgi:hypothetical protein